MIFPLLSETFLAVKPKFTKGVVSRSVEPNRHLVPEQKLKTKQLSTGTPNEDVD